MSAEVARPLRTHWPIGPLLTHWPVGTVLRGTETYLDGESNTKTIRITHVSDQIILAVNISTGVEGMWVLDARDWYEVIPENPTTVPLPEYGKRIRHVQHEDRFPLQVTLDEIESQRTSGWPDFHPEDFCNRCGNRNVSWATSAENWNPVMRGGDPDGFGPWGEIVCIPCFIEIAEWCGVKCAWTLALDDNGTTWLSIKAGAL